MAYPIHAIDDKMDNADGDRHMKRAFEIVDELNKISGDYLRDYTISIRQIDVTTSGDSCQTNKFTLSISKHVHRP